MTGKARKIIDKVNKLHYKKTFGLLETLVFGIWVACVVLNPTIFEWLLGFVIFISTVFFSKKIRGYYKWT